MPLQQLTSTDGFIAFDFDEGPGVGVVRLAPKVLRDGAELLARSTTYAAASFGIQAGGASAGLNAKADDRETALAAFVEEVAPLVESDRWLVGPGLGVAADDLSALPKVDERARAFDPSLQAAGAAAAAAAAAAEVSGASFAIAGSGSVADAAAAMAGVPADSALDVEADVLFVAGRSGVLDHDVAPTVQARFVVPLTPVPVTARALAVLGRAGVVVVPDFLATAAPLLAALDPDGGDPVERVGAIVGALASEGTGLWLAAATKAEDFLRTWRTDLPFGRPLA